SKDRRGIRSRVYVAKNRFDKGWICILAHTRARAGDIFKRRPIIVDHRDHLIVLLLRLTPWMIGGGNPASLRAPHQKRIHSLWVCSGEKTRHRASLGDAKNVGTFDVDIIHHSANVVRALLK